VRQGWLASSWPAPWSRQGWLWAVLARGGGQVLDMKGPALVRVAPGTVHNVTTLGAGRNKLIAFFSSNNPGAAPAGDPYPVRACQGGQRGSRHAGAARVRGILC
jgi:hypothetical protein